MSSQLKEPNPKDIVGVRRAPLSCLSGQVLFEVGLAMLEGARKYGKHNWRAAEVVASVYFDANMRHMWDYWEGQDIDPVSGIHHVSKAIAGLHVLRDAMIQGTLIDDRPIGLVGLGIDELNKKASQLVDVFPNARVPFTRIPLNAAKDETAS